MDDKLMATVPQVTHHAGPHVAQANEAYLQQAIHCKWTENDSEAGELVCTLLTREHAIRIT